MRTQRGPAALPKLRSAPGEGETPGVPRSAPGNQNQCGRAVPVINALPGQADLNTIIAKWIKTL